MEESSLYILKLYRNATMTFLKTIKPLKVKTSKADEKHTFVTHLKHCS